MIILASLHNNATSFAVVSVSISVAALFCLCLFYFCYPCLTCFILLLPTTKTCYNFYRRHIAYPPAWTIKTSMPRVLQIPFYRQFVKSTWNMCEIFDHFTCVGEIARGPTKCLPNDIFVSWKKTVCPENWIIDFYFDRAAPLSCALKPADPFDWGPLRDITA